VQSNAKREVKPLKKAVGVLQDWRPAFKWGIRPADLDSTSGSFGTDLRWSAGSYFVPPNGAQILAATGDSGHELTLCPVEPGTLLKGGSGAKVRSILLR
jgi:hypothetical protein